jgi:hypothetical protein
MPISQAATESLPAATGGSLTLGYVDDAYGDNGYYSHDDGDSDQCKDQSGAHRGRAVVHLEIHRVAQPALPANTVYGQCIRTDATHETCHIDRPDVTVGSESYPSVQFCSGDIVTVTANGCVQTGGSGKTWKDYVNPSGPNADRLYHGMISIPGSTAGPVQLRSVVGHALPPSTGGILTLGYVDDDYGDNGYYSHDDGTQNQCRNKGAASVDIAITHNRDTSLGCGSIFPVTGTTTGTAPYTQSETAAAVVERPAGRRVVVTFNDLTQNPSDQTIQWTPNTPSMPGSRSVLSGASLMGWAYSDDDGIHWTYAGRVLPTIPGWPVLWGDPALTAVPDPSLPVVMMSNLAVPSAEFTSAELVTSVGGACIAKSTDGAQSFALAQCISNTDAPNTLGHFYDGETMAATPAGAIFVAFDDTDTSQIDVWSAPNYNAPFVRIAQPFPGMSALTHARLRAAADGSVYVATAILATLSNGQSAPVVYLNRYVNGAWGTPQQASEAMVASFGSIPWIDLHSEVLGSDLNVRMGPQFSFDVGSASAGGQDAVRLMVTRTDSSGHFFIEGSACAADLSGCHVVPEWSVGPTAADGTLAQAFGPSVRASAARRLGGGPINVPIPGEWLSAYYVVHGNSTTAVQTGHMYLNYLNGTPVGASVELPDLLAVCSDDRPSGPDYWGDYNDMVVLNNVLASPAFVSFVSRDQQLGCIKRWPYVSEHQHVSAVRWAP